MAFFARFNHGKKMILQKMENIDLKLVKGGQGREGEGFRIGGE